MNIIKSCALCTYNRHTIMRTSNTIRFTHKKVIAFSASYGNSLRPWPVQSMFTSWHRQVMAACEHEKAEILSKHTKAVRKYNGQRGNYYCFTKNLRQLASSSQVISQSTFPSHTIDWFIQGPRWHLCWFSLHLALTVINKNHTS